MSNEQPEIRWTSEAVKPFPVSVEKVRRRASLKSEQFTVELEVDELMCGFYMWTARIRNASTYLLDASVDGTTDDPEEVQQLATWAGRLMFAQSPVPVHQLIRTKDGKRSLLSKAIPKDYREVARALVDELFERKDAIAKAALCVDPESSQEAERARAQAYAEVACLLAGAVDIGLEEARCVHPEMNPSEGCTICGYQPGTDEDDEHV